MVTEAQSKIVGFIHFILHEDVVDGAPNAFITAFYVQERFRGEGISSSLLRAAVIEAAKRGAVDIETSTIHSSAKSFYKKRHFRQTVGDIAEVFMESHVASFQGRNVPFHRQVPS